MPWMEFDDPADDAYYVGRNGEGKCRGVSAQKIDNPRGGLLTLRPVTSRGQTARCCIAIPLDQAQALVDAIREAAGLPG